MRAALTHPSAAPIPRPNGMQRSGGQPYRVATSAVVYWATEAVAAKEMSRAAQTRHMSATSAARYASGRPRRRRTSSGIHLILQLLLGEGARPVLAQQS